MRKKAEAPATPPASSEEATILREIRDVLKSRYGRGEVVKQED